MRRMEMRKVDTWLESTREYALKRRERGKETWNQSKNMFLLLHKKKNVFTPTALILTLHWLTVTTCTVYFSTKHKLSLHSTSHEQQESKSTLKYTNETVKRLCCFLLLLVLTGISYTLHAAIFPPSKKHTRFYFCPVLFLTRFITS